MLEPLLRAKLGAAERELLPACVTDLDCHEAAQALTLAFAAVSGQDADGCIRHGEAAHTAAGAKLRAGGWEHPAWRELYGLGALCAAAGHDARGDTASALRLADCA